MQIQINSDINISGNEELSDLVRTVINDQLGRFSDQITRVEVHLTDEDGKKDGRNDKRCMIEARLEGLNPVAVTDHSDTHEQALKGAADKLKTALTTRIGRLRKH